MRLSKNKTYNFIHYSTLLLIIHGTGYFIIKNYLKVETEYGLRPNEWQSFWQGSHVLLSPISVFALGILWKGHIVKNFVHGLKRKLSGTTLTALFLFMIISGYLLQITYQESAKEKILYLHLISSALFSFSYIFHTYKRYKTNK